MKRAFRNLSLRSKIALFTNFMVGISLLILTFITLQIDQRYSRQDLEEQASILLDTLPYSLRDELYFESVDELRDVAGKIGESENLKRFVIYDRNGVILADSANKNLTITREPDIFGSELIAQNASTIWEEDQLISGKAVSLSESVIGAVSVAISTDGLKRKTSAIISQSIWITLLILFISVSFSFMLARQISDPVRELMQVARNMASGDSDIRVRVVANDEIGQLGRAFNEMTESIQNRERDLRELTASLEQKVIARTEELRQRNEELVQMAISDPLTKIHNRRYFFDLANKEYERAKRYQHPLSLVLSDADRFKNANDTFGHLVGDQILINLAELLASHVRSADVVARYGGEEFVILMPEIDGQDAANTVERLRKKIETQPMVAGKDINITVSFGVACWDGKEELSFESLLHRADKALYCAKAKGRNCVAIWEETLE